MKSSLPPPTHAEAERIERMKSDGCAACRAIGKREYKRLELHHILEGGRRISHTHTVFLCRGHHQGDWSPHQLSSLKPNHRIAISDGRKSFCKVFGSERELWEQQQARLGEDVTWPTSKILPRRVKSKVQVPRQEDECDS